MAAPDAKDYRGAQLDNETRASSPQRDGALGHFTTREEAMMTAQWIAITLDGAAALGKSGAPLSNIEFFLGAALLIFVTVAVSAAAITLARKNYQAGWRKVAGTS